METSLSPENPGDAPTHGGFGSYPGSSNGTALQSLQSRPGRERDPYCPQAPSSYRLRNRRQKTAVQLCACLEVSHAFIISPPKKNGLVPEAPNNNSKCIVHGEAHRRSRRLLLASDLMIHIPVSVMETHTINNGSNGPSYPKANPSTRYSPQSAPRHMVRPGALRPPRNYPRRFFVLTVI